MNSLSLLIYLAGVVNNLGAFMTLLSVLSLVSIFIITFLWLISVGDIDKELSKRIINFIKIPIVVGLITASFSTFIPSRQTVLLIAASEMGEKVLNNEKVGQVIDPSIDLITTWMKNETAEIKKKMETKR